MRRVNLIVIHWQIYLFLLVSGSNTLTENIIEFVLLLFVSFSFDIIVFGQPKIDGPPLSEVI